MQSEQSDSAPSKAQAVIYSREQHSISRNKIDPDALKIMYRLLRNGFKAYMVGGGVRDLLLGKKPKDFDIATDATPKKIKALFRNSRIIGRRFKLVHIFFGQGKIIEVSTFRDFSDPIEPELVEGSEAEQKDPAAEDALRILRDNKYGTEATDALRRDLTINGLFYDLATFSIIDYVGGMRDLIDGVIRVIGKPEERFIEDPVRMLRTVRHSAKNKFTIEQAALQAISTHRELILKSPPMRVYEELKKDLSSGHLLEILRSLASSELLEFILPELMDNVPALFHEDSMLGRVLTEVDTRSRDGDLPSACVVLALLVLAQHQDTTLAEGAGFAELPRHEQLKLSAEYFSLTPQLREFLGSKFHTLAVPRREKEKIEDLLSLWAYLHNTPRERIKGNKLRMGDLADDARVFLEILHTEKGLLRLFNLNNQGGRGYKHDDDRQAVRGGRRPRQRRSRGRQLW